MTNHTSIFLFVLPSESNNGMPNNEYYCCSVSGNMPNNGYFTSVLNPANNETFLEELVNQNEPSCGVNDHSSQPMPQSSVNPGKGSNKRTHNFNQEEDEMLCITWVNVCIDPIHGTDQSSATYWNRMLEYYNAHKKFAAVRNANSLQNRWSGIQAAVSRFSGCYSQIERANQSGVVIQDTVNKNCMYEYLKLRNIILYVNAVLCFQ